MSDTDLGLLAVIDVQGRRCVVVGAGAGGRRKASALSAAGADVIVIDPAEAAPDEIATSINRPWHSGDTKGAFLVVVATSDPVVNQAVADEARADGALVLRADRAREGDVQLPAVHRQEFVTLAVSSGGRSPALAAVVRDEVARFLESEAERWQELGVWAAENRPQSIEAVAARLADMRGDS